MADETPDTTSPLDGDGSNVIDPSGPVDPNPESENVDEAEYETSGRTVVKTRRGRRFASSNKDLPVIHAGGVKVTKDQAEFLVKESRGLVQIQDETKED